MQQARPCGRTARPPQQPSQHRHRSAWASPGRWRFSARIFAQSDRAISAGISTVLTIPATSCPDITVRVTAGLAFVDGPTKRRGEYKIYENNVTITPAKHAKYDVIAFGSRAASALFISPDPIY